MNTVSHTTLHFSGFFHPLSQLWIIKEFLCSFPDIVQEVIRETEVEPHDLYWGL